MTCHGECVKTSHFKVLQCGGDMGIIKRSPLRSMLSWFKKIAEDFRVAVIFLCFLWPTLPSCGVLGIFNIRNCFNHLSLLFFFISLCSWEHCTLWVCLPARSTHQVGIHASYYFLFMTFHEGLNENEFRAESPARSETLRCFVGSGNCRYSPETIKLYFQQESKEIQFFKMFRLPASIMLHLRICPWIGFLKLLPASFR